MIGAGVGTLLAIVCVRVAARPSRRVCRLFFVVVAELSAPVMELFCERRVDRLELFTAFCATTGVRLEFN